MQFIEKYALLAKEATKLKMPEMPKELPKTPEIAPPDLTPPSQKKIDLNADEIELPDVNKTGKQPLFGMKPPKLSNPYARS